MVWKSFVGLLKKKINTDYSSDDVGLNRNACAVEVKVGKYLKSVTSRANVK